MKNTNKEMNKTFDKIYSLLCELKESVRDYFSRLLMDYNENNKLSCFYPFGDKDAFGLSELEKLHIDQLYQQQNEGIIWFHFEGEAENTFHELNELCLEDLIELIKNIENDY